MKTVALVFKFSVQGFKALSIERPIRNPECSFRIIYIHRDPILTAPIPAGSKFKTSEKGFKGLAVLGL